MASSRSLFLKVNDGSVSDLYVAQLDLLSRSAQLALRSHGYLNELAGPGLDRIGVRPQLATVPMTCYSFP